VEFDRTSKLTLVERPQKSNKNQRTRFGADQDTIVEESVDMQGVGRVGGLKPLCIATGMSCAERDEKRKKEIDAFAACFVHLG